MHERIFAGSWRHGAVGSSAVSTNDTSATRFFNKQAPPPETQKRLDTLAGQRSHDYYK
jgi:hypothetical protein